MAETNIRHLIAFLECARLGSFSAAAESVGRSQPAISNAINAIESSAGVALLRRGKSGASLTPAGEKFANRIRIAEARLRNVVIETSNCDKARGFQVVKNLTNGQLRALSAIVDNGGFTAAARALDIAAPSVHRAARDLERVLGVAGGAPL